METRTNKYWQNRAAARMASYHRNSDSTIYTITQAYDKAIRDINVEIEKIFGKVVKGGRISPVEAKELLNQPITPRELEALREQLNTIKDPVIKRQLLNRLNAPAYRARMTRLQALKEQVYIESKKIADVEIQASTMGYIDTINDAYYKNLFDIQKGFGTGFDVASMPAKTIESILKNPWSGTHFSKRVWHNTDVLAGKLNEVITAGFKSGASIRKMALELEDMSMMGMHAANRLVRTETTYMANAAEMESYKEAEIEEYVFIATLDLRTSNICRKYDGRVFKVKDAKAGENMPAMHPYCRSTTRAYFGPDTLKDIQRRARDPETGKTYFVPADMTYEQWHKEHVVNKYGQDQAEVMKKKVMNDVSDRKQYDKYKTVLGADAPKSFDNFQELKYNKGDEYSLLSPEGAGETFTQGAKIPDELLVNKPSYSPAVNKWLDGGGKIEIDNGTWKYTNSEGVSVLYRNGYPDFKGSGHVIQEVDIGPFRERLADFRLADQLAPNGPKNPRNTWHHNEDGRTLQEVNRRTHEMFTHKGGISFMKKGRT